MRTKQQGTDTKLERKTRTEAGKIMDDLKREPVHNTDTKTGLSFTLRVFLGVASVGLALFFLREAAYLVNSLLLAWIIVVCASPLLFWLQRRKVSNWLVFLITLAAIIAVFGVAVLLVVVGLRQLAGAVPAYASSAENLKTALEGLVTRLGIDSPDVSAVIEEIGVGQLLDVILKVTKVVAEGLSNVLVIGLMVIYLLVESFRMPAKISKEIQLGTAYVGRLASFSGRIRGYVVITTTVGLVTGILDTILFLILGVDFAVLWGILAFLLSYVPILGFWMAAVPPTILALLEMGPAAALVVFVGVVLMNGIAENLVKPKLMSEGLNLSPFVVFVSVVFWSAVLGPMGAIFSIPMTLIVRDLILEADDRNRWLARLISAGKESQVAADTKPEDAAANGRAS
jgi:predicted PurR-regulated permease PerM